MVRLTLIMALLSVIVPGAVPQGFAHAAAQEQPSPDIVVVVLDDARAGEADTAMPRTAALLPGSTHFRNFFSTTPVCCPARASMLRGQYAHNTGVLTNGGGDNPHPGGWQAFRPLEDQTIASALQGAGYTTALVGKYLNNYDRDIDTPEGWSRWHAGSHQPEYYNGQDDYLPDKRADRAAELAALPGPVFIWYADVIPHNAPACDGHPCPARRHEDEYLDLGKTKRMRLQSIRTIDDGVAGVAAAMGPDRWERACVVIVSDNGYLLGEHGLSGKQQPYDEAVRVGATFSAGCGLTPGQDARIAGTLDLAPTLASIAGVTLPWTVDGLDLTTNQSRTSILLEAWGTGDRGSTFQAVRSENQTYVRYADGSEVFWDRTSDPAENTNLWPAMSPAEREPWIARLEQLRECAGASC